VLSNILKFPCLGAWPAALCWKNDGQNRFFINILETIYYTKINVQNRNKADKIPRNFNEPCMINSFGDKFFSRIFYFWTLRNFVLSRIFHKYHKFGCSYKTYRKKSIGYFCNMIWRIFYEYCATDSSEDIIFLKIFWFADIKMRHFLS